ncbi:hypothetical protein RS130_08630 [Paraglaciecola aquimarina]|uniref:Uncharacterized protein n=1 Tax=Paraglaciecola aquimarina TaxID=1235557 RepID=A0ABU3SVH1_9ALTE|nr:hypothetical protein [Paraglaciecola aquimarina]MDU0353988.1 hypothetical protein [Paraglaciecola aquimarina]
MSNSALRYTPEGQSANEQGAGMSGRAKQLAEQLKLNAAQQKQLAQTMENMQQSMAAARESSRGMGGGPPQGPNDTMKKIRSQMDIELRSFLSPEQMEQYKALNQKNRRPRGNREKDDNFQRGTVWVLRDGQPSRVNVRVGISDLEYSEIESDELAAGDLVTVRAQKVNQ